MGIQSISQTGASYSLCQLFLWHYDLHIHLQDKDKQVLSKWEVLMQVLQKIYAVDPTILLYPLKRLWPKLKQPTNQHLQFPYPPTLSINLCTTNPQPNSWKTMIPQLFLGFFSPTGWTSQAFHPVAGYEQLNMVCGPGNNSWPKRHNSWVGYSFPCWSMIWQVFGRKHNYTLGWKLCFNSTTYMMASKTKPFRWYPESK